MFRASSFNLLTTRRLLATQSAPAAAVKIANNSCSIKRLSLEERYHFKTYEELCHRVSQNAGPKPIRQDVNEAMLERRFCPAGNTLLAGLRPIRPNCSILPTVTDENIAWTIERSRRLWRHYTGIGFDLSGCRDPVNALRRLMDENRKIEFEDLCQRGNMAVILASHPKATDFVTAKADETSAGQLYGFNLSLAFESDEQFYQLLQKAEKTKSGLLWEAAVSAWYAGCPGIAFLNRFRASPREKELDNLMSSFNGIGAIPPISTMVPCGEQGMRENESCNLGVINLASPYHYDGKMVSFEKLRKTTRIAVRFLDGVVDQLEIDDELMERRTHQMRRVGLGVTGFADALIRAGFAYASPEARNYGKKLAKTISEEADLTSRKLGQELGPYVKGANRRNLTVTCCQPTGNITRLLGTRGYSIEPLMVEATQIHWRDHLAMQAAWQEHVENAVSKTVNLPNEATIDDVLGVFREAYLKRSIKGVSLYRDGSRRAQPLSLEPTTRCATCQ